MEKEHEKTLHANGLCRVRCVQRLTEGKLEALGISMGDAMVLLDVLHAAAPPTPTAGAPAERVANVTPKRPSMRPFPKCGPTRYPDLEGWDPYKTGLGLRQASCTFPALRKLLVSSLVVLLATTLVPLSPFNCK